MSTARRMIWRNRENRSSRRFGRSNTARRSWTTRTWRGPSTRWGPACSTWVQRVHSAGLFAADARVIGLTSEGNAIAWRGYAAVAAAKSALESVSRAIAVEFAPHGIRSNIVQAGVTDTPALRVIPGSARMKAGARMRNPFGRLTAPEDVADVVYLLSLDEAGWINGALIRADGGEHIA